MNEHEQEREKRRLKKTRRREVSEQTGWNRKKLAKFQGFETDEDDWNEDDLMLFEFRRKKNLQDSEDTEETEETEKSEKKI